MAHTNTEAENREKKKKVEEGSLVELGGPGYLTVITVMYERYSRPHAFDHLSDGSSKRLSRGLRGDSAPPATRASGDEICSKDWCRNGKDPLW